AMGATGAGEIGFLVAGFEGTEAEVEWLTSTLYDQWCRAGGKVDVVPEHQTRGLWMRLAQFPVEGDAPLVIKATLRPSRTVDFVERLRRIDPKCDIQSHAGSGVVIARLSQFGSG